MSTAGAAEFELHISAEEMSRYYRGEAITVRVTATNGQVIQFPASMLRPHVTPAGIDGYFRIEWSAEGKLQRLERLR